MSDFGDCKVCVFDAYGTLFDVHSAVAQYREQLAEKADALSLTWRTKQLEYTWLRSLMNAYAPFDQVTRDALDYACDLHDVAQPDLKEQLMGAYLKLDAYPEVVDTLKQLTGAGIRCAILTNGSPKMIEAAVASAGLNDYLECSLSVDTIGVFKPDPRVYQLAIDALGVKADDVSFQSSNAWDAAGAAYFGFNVAWINRFGQRPERLPATPHAELLDLSELPKMILQHP